MSVTVFVAFIAVAYRSEGFFDSIFVDFVLVRFRMVLIFFIPWSHLSVLSQPFADRYTRDPYTGLISQDPSFFCLVFLTDCAICRYPGRH